MSIPGNNADGMGGLLFDWVQQKLEEFRVIWPKLTLEKLQEAGREVMKENSDEWITTEDMSKRLQDKLQTMMSDGS